MSKQKRGSAWVTATAIGACALGAPLARAVPASLPMTLPTTAPTPAPAARAEVAPGAAVLPVIDACPKELSVKQSVVADIAGWTSVSPQEGYPFARIAFYSGPPADDKRVVPTFENRTSSGLHDGWMLRRQPVGYWIQCQYGNTAAVVIRKLDDANDFCVADYDPRFSTLVVKHWACMPGRPAPAPAPKAASARPRTAPTKWMHGP